VNHAQSRHMPSMAEVARLYTEEKLGSNAIAARYGCCGESIRYLLCKAGVPIRSKTDAARLSHGAVDTIWTEERLAKLRKLWAEGKTGQQIAEILGDVCSRRAVIAKAHRLGLAGRKASIAIRRQRAATVAPETLKRMSLDYSLIQLPPHLQVVFDALVAEVRAERGVG
jgi:hypothetical protein